ncbi:MAG: SDR family oxidoreductase [Bellilinea sp.]|nr:SDR family oxidoreductase [Bellilinea sp.]
MNLKGKTALVTGGAHRVGKILSIALAEAGVNVIVHYGSSQAAAQQTLAEIEGKGVKGWMVQADLAKLERVEELVEYTWKLSPFQILVNNAAIFEPLHWNRVTLDEWQRHMNINLTAPFLLSQAFARKLSGQQGRIVNILDWRALRPADDHLPYTISKAALAALTRSLAVALAPSITVNGIALGAILPPSDGGETEAAIRQVPAGRWARAEEVGRALIFLLEGASYTTGEILHVDGGRHLI